MVTTATAATVKQANIPENAHPLFGQMTQMFGLHPIVTFATFAIGIMLFGEEAASLMVGWLVAIPVAFVLGIGVVFCQRYMFDDQWGAAVGKAIIVALLTAIPTSIPTVLLIPSGALGIIKAFRGINEKRSLTTASDPPLTLLPEKGSTTSGSLALDQRNQTPGLAPSSNAPSTPSIEPNSFGSTAHYSNSEIKKKERMPRYDGVYVTKLPVDYGITAHSYLRFYEDGTVIESSIQGERSAEVMRWFDKSDRSLSTGSHNASGDEIQFSVTSDSGTVDYRGRIVGGELHLHSYSHINGFETDDEWAFLAAP